MPRWQTISSRQKWSNCSCSVYLIARVGHEPTRDTRAKGHKSMDAERFDTMVRRLGMTRLTRISALRGLAGSAAALLVGGALLPTTTEAADRNRRQRTICHCPDT